MDKTLFNEQLNREDIPFKTQITLTLTQVEN